MNQTQRSVVSHGGSNRGCGTLGSVVRSETQGWSLESPGRSFENGTVYVRWQR